MKCPKCDYLGFETGDRCKNCGYDFSLASVAPVREPELLLRETSPLETDTDHWLNQLDARIGVVRQPEASVVDPLGAMSLDTVAVAASAATSSSTLSAASSAPAQAQVRQRPGPAPSLPLFHAGADSDEPLIKMPPAPRPPLAVRRTPEKPRLRTVPKPARRVHPEPEPDPVLAFAEEAVAPVRVDQQRQAPRSHTPAPVQASGAIRRVTAAVVDHTLLLTIDIIVVYFTFQIAGLSLSSWQTVPVLPFALFLALLKVAYFCVFTMVGGQTVGKMATGIRVVADSDRDVEPARAVQRTLAALVSVATVGIGYLPALVGGDRRALHDRVAHTRVVRP